VKAACREAAAVCAGRGTDLARLALQFSMSHDGIASHLVGMASPEQVALDTIHSTISLAGHPVVNLLLV
jgi:aryl-alcohol dehydrogenase-like predicted oxidoreductase